MRRERHKGNSRRFQDEEGPSTSYLQEKKLVLHKAPKQPIMSTFLEEEGEWHGYGGKLDHEIVSDYLIEYKSQSSI